MLPLGLATYDPPNRKESEVHMTIQLSRVFHRLALVLLVGICLYFLTPPKGNPALAQEGTGSDRIPEASFYCPSVNNIAAFDNRIHLRCSQANGGVTYYAYPNDLEHATVANQILAIASSAFTLNRGIWLYYNSDSSLNPPGCNVSDCRGLTGVSMI